MTIYVGNCPYSVTEEDIRSLFSEYGEIKTISLPIDRMTQQKKGFGFVDFTDTADEDKAIEGLNSGTDNLGRPLSPQIQNRMIKVLKAESGGASSGGSSSGGRVPYGGNRSRPGTNSFGENRAARSFSGSSYGSGSRSSSPESGYGSSPSSGGSRRNYGSSTGGGSNSGSSTYKSGGNYSTKKSNSDYN